MVTGQATYRHLVPPITEFSLLVADGQQIDMDRLDGEEPAPEEIASLSLEQRLASGQPVHRGPAAAAALLGRVSLNLPAIIAGDSHAAPDLARRRPMEMPG